MGSLFNAVVLSILVLAPLLVGLLLKKNKLLDDKIVCWLIILTGVILRIIYITYTPVGVRQHDVHEFFENNGGHGEYICYLFQNHSLPDFDPREIWQFYHPPLHHIICAAWLTLLEFFGIPAKYDGVNTLPFLTVVYSSLFCVFSYLSFKRLNLKSSAICFSTALVTFHPTLIILSGSINNDMLSSLFGMMAVYFTIRWSQDKKWLDIIMIALCVGLGMFTKLSVGLLAPAVAAVFLIVFIKNIKQFKKLISQFVVFAVICCPLGLYWSVRNYVKFGVPLNYVPKLSENASQYIDVPAFERLINWSPYQFASPFTQWKSSGASYNEFNPFIALLKNSMFDESTFFANSITMQSFCTMLFLVNIVIVLFVIAAIITTLIKNKEVTVEIKVMLALIVLVIFGNYINFCLNYPHVCTQNMRYCVPLIFVGAVFVGYFIDGRNSDSPIYYKNSVALVKKCTLAYSVLSIIVYVGLLYDAILG